MRTITLVAILAGILSANQCRFYISQLQQDLHFYKEAPKWVEKQKSLKRIEKNIERIKQKCK